MKPSRVVIDRSPHRVVGMVACGWIQPRSVHYESRLERTFVHRALLIPGLRQVVHQPCNIEFEREGRKHTYTPDFALLFPGESRAVVEVKPEEFVEENRWKLDAAALWLAEKDISLFVVTDSHLYRDDIDYASAWLLRAARTAPPSSQLEQIISFIRDAGTPVSLEALEQVVSVPQNAILHLVARGQLELDPPILVSPTSLVRLHLEEQENADIRVSSWFDTTPWKPAA